MGRKALSALKLIYVRIYQSDWEKLQELYPRLDKSTVIRAIVRSYLKKVNEKLSQKGALRDDTPDIELTVE